VLFFIFKQKHIPTVFTQQKRLLSVFLRNMSLWNALAVFTLHTWHYSHLFVIHTTRTRTRSYDLYYYVQSVSLQRFVGWFVTVKLGSVSQAVFRIRDILIRIRIRIHGSVLLDYGSFSFLQDANKNKFSYQVLYLLLTVGTLT
jgi:hypothetical protein